MKRILPYGYQYKNGVIAIHPKETETVKEIFNEYLGGKSLLNIADRLNKEQIEYMPGAYGWNKSRIKRLIEDERYLGATGYPPIIDEYTHQALIRIKSEKNTQKYTDRKADIFNLGVPILCSACGEEMIRRHDNRNKCRERWCCKNIECKTTVNIADSDLLRAITDRLNTVIANPSIIRNISQIVNEPSVEVRKLNNEISRMLEGASFDKKELRKKIMECASLKYREIDSISYKTQRLKADFKNISPLSEFSIDLFRKTVKAVNFDTDGTVSIMLINDQIIGKECHNGRNNNASSTESCTENTCYN